MTGPVTRGADSVGGVEETAVPAASAAAGTAERPARRPRRGLLVLAVVIAAWGVLPFVPVAVPGLLPGPIDSPGSLQILAICLVFAGLAMSYDVVFGYTGLLSFGHALYFALGVYGTNLLMGRGLPYAAAVAVSVLGVAVVATLLGAVALRARGVAFAMVTLAFAEAFAIFLIADPLRFTGGEEGVAVVGDRVPDLLRGVVNTANLYWLALAFAVLAYGVSRLATSSLAGRVWQAVRENPDRVELLGLRPVRFSLQAYVVGALLAALGGTVYLLLVRGANPGVAASSFTLALLVMVVIGGAGRLWGAALGGVLYGLASLRLTALSTSGLLDGLPDWLERVLGEPLFVLGVLFVVLVLFVPGGVGGLADRVRRRAARRVAR